MGLLCEGIKTESRTKDFHKEGKEKNKRKRLGWQQFFFIRKKIVLY